MLALADCLILLGFILIAASAMGVCDGTASCRDDNCPRNCMEIVPGKTIVLERTTSRGAICKDIYFKYCNGTYMNAKGDIMRR